MFSELVDACIRGTGRPDELVTITRIANEIVREICKRDDWDDDLVEELIPYPDPPLAHGAPLVWNPEVGRQRFRRPAYVEDGCGCEVKYVKPSSRMKFTDRFFYRSGESLVFSKNICFPIKFSYFAYPAWLKYYKTNERPAEWDIEASDWKGSPSQVTIDLVSNWVLERHWAVVEAGTMSRFFALKQDPRQTVHYSIYQQGISHIIRSESSAELAAQ